MISNEEKYINLGSLKRNGDQINTPLWFMTLEDDTDAAIYSMLRSLVKHGLARKEGQERDGRRPSRTVFRITPPGRAALRQTLTDAWQVVARDRDPVCAALAAADEFEAGELDALLRRRRTTLSDRQDTLSAVAAGAPSGLLSRRETALLAAEIAWIDAELSRSNRQEN